MKNDSAKFKEWLSAISRAKVLVIGDVMLDHYIWGDSSRISPEAPVPVVKVSRESFAAGGAANVALNIRDLGGKAMLCGRLGKDLNGDRLIGITSSVGVEWLPDCARQGIETIVKTRVICRRQQLCRLDRESAPATFAFSGDDIACTIAPALSGIDAVIISDYAKGAISTEFIAAIKRIAPPGLLIAMDPKPRAVLTYSGLGLMTPNRAEAFQLAGIDDDGGAFPGEDVCRRIYDKHSPRLLVVTLGADGMLLCENGDVRGVIPTFAREVFDVSGAGDTVISALVLGLSAGLPLDDAAKFANIAAGVVVGKLGTATATPDEIIAYVEASK